MIVGNNYYEQCFAIHYACFSLAEWLELSLIETAKW